MDYLKIVILLILSINYTQSTLQLVHVFFRHGSRTPETNEMYPADPYKPEDFLPLGHGQLTNDGKKLAYTLGQKLRQRYNSFLGDLYTPEIVETRSTDYDRTKMSALLVLAGLFPPPPSQQWDENLAWLPIPYQYDKYENDYLMRRPRWYCPTYAKELKSVLSSATVQKDLKNEQKILQYLTKHTKKPINKLSDVFDLYQVLLAETTMNLTLPEWTKPVFLYEIHRLTAKQSDYENYNTILKRLNGGRMLAKVIGNMLEKSNSSRQPNDRKIYLFSGHENNVLNILAALNLFQLHVPAYSSAVMIELHCNNAKECGVKVFYLRNVHAQAELLKLDACDELCPLDRFVQITKPHVPVNYTAECGSAINLD